MWLSRWTDGLGRIFRGSFADLSRNSAAKSNALYNPSCDTRLPQLRPKASTIPPVSTSRPFPLVHSHWTKQTIWNILNFSFTTFREANYFRDLSRPSISLSRKWCSITPLHKQYIEFFFVAHLFLYGLSRFPHSKCHEKQKSESLDLVILGSGQPSAGFWPTIHQFQTLTVHCQSARYLQKMTKSLLVVSRYSHSYQKTKGLKYPCKYSSLFAIIIHHD